MTVEEKVAIDRLDVRADLQPRESLDEAIVAEYAAAMEAGDEFPPIRVVVSEDGDGYMWMWDGFHRVAAAKRAGKKRIHARIETGTLRDAILRSVQANATHGLRRSNADKRKAVQTLLQDPEWSQWSNREIARRTKTSHPFVAQIRETLDTGNVSSARKYRDGSGEVRTMETGPIAEANEARSEGDDGVNGDILGYLVRTSVEYASRFIKDANRATAKAALKYERQNQNRSSLIDLLERRIRYLEQDAGKDGASQDEVLDAVEAYLDDSYATEDFEGRLHALRAICQFNDYDVIRARLGRKPAATNGVVHAVDEMVRRVSEQRNEQAKAAKATMEQLRAGVWAYLDDDYETYDLDGRIQALTRMLNARDYVQVEPYVPENHDHSALARATRQAVRALNEEKRRLEREVDADARAADPDSEFAPVWRLETQVRRYLDMRFGIRGDGIDSEDNLRQRLDKLSEDVAYDVIGSYIDSSQHDQFVAYRRSDLVQAVNNVADTLRTRIQGMQTPEPTVRYESVEVPQTVEAVEVVDPEDDTREAAVRVTYLPQTEIEAVPSPQPEEEAGQATIDLALTLFPEDGKFHLELSERDIPSGPYRGRIQNLHQVLDVAISRVWPDAKSLLAGEEATTEAPEDDAPDEASDAGPAVGDFVKWGSGPGTQGKLINTSNNGGVGYVRDAGDVIRKFPMHMLTVVQQAAVS